MNGLFASVFATEDLREKIIEPKLIFFQEGITLSQSTLSHRVVGKIGGGRPLVGMFATLNYFFKIIEVGFKKKSKKKDVLRAILWHLKSLHITSS